MDTSLSTPRSNQGFCCQMLATPSLFGLGLGSSRLLRIEASQSGCQTFPLRVQLAWAKFCSCKPWSGSVMQNLLFSLSLESILALGHWSQLCPTAPYIPHSEPTRCLCGLVCGILLPLWPTAIHCQLHTNPQWLKCWCTNISWRRAHLHV